MIKELPNRIVGIDYGLARLGVSLSDERKIIATPMKTLLAERKAESTAQKLIEELERHAKEHHYHIASIVVGLPLLMSGKQGFFADEAKHFIALLQQLTTIPIIPWDERLTSVQAERSMREGNMSRKKRSKAVDSVAALIILQSYLDAESIKNSLQDPC